MYIDATNVSDWRRALLPSDATIREAVSCLDRSGLQLVMVVEEDLKLVGTITDGDIRRGLLRGLGLDEPALSIVHRRPFIVPPSLDASAVTSVLNTNGIRQMPIVNDRNQAVGLYSLSNVSLSAKRPNLMVVMAGGKGTRLRPHTENCPKPMLEVAGRPMLEHVLDRAIADGFGRFVFAVHYLGHMIEEYFGDGSKWNVEIGYVREKEPLGTGGALGLLDSKETQPLIVTNGDVLSDVRYQEILQFHSKHSADATMAVRAHEWQNPFGVVKIDGMEIVGFEEKPLVRSHINAGIYAINPGALAHLAVNEYCDMPTLFERVKAAGQRAIVYPMHEPWLDVGRPDDLATAQGTRRA